MGNPPSIEITEFYLDGREKSRRILDSKNTELDRDSWEYSRTGILETATHSKWTPVPNPRPGQPNATAEVLDTETQDPLGRITGLTRDNLQTTRTYLGLELASEKVGSLEPRTFQTTWGQANNVQGEIRLRRQNTGTDGVREWLDAEWYEDRNGTVYRIQSSGPLGNQSVSEEQLTNLPPGEISRTTQIDASGVRTLTARSWDPQTGREVLRQQRGSLPVSETVSRGGRVYFRGTAGQTPTAYEYDSRGRVTKITDPRGAVTTMTYSDSSSLPSTVNGPGTSIARTFDSAGRVQSETRNGSTRFYEYDAAGRLFRTWGGGEYPQEFAYDRRGRMTALKTFGSQASDSGGSEWFSNTWPQNKTPDYITTWTYTTLPASSSVTKKFSDGTQQQSSYNQNGLLTQIENRSVTNQFVSALSLSYNSAGELKARSDNAGTATRFIYDSAGRLQELTDDAGTHRYTYQGNLLASETVTTGPLAGYSLALTYDQTGRRQRRVVSFGQIPVADLGYTYSEDQLQQLEDRLPDGVQTRYAYEPGTDRIVERTVRSGSSLLLRESRTWSEGRLATIETRRGDGTVVAGYGWGYDAQGRRTTRTLDAGEAWEYEYNRRNEVIRGIKKNGATPLDGYDFGYGYDGIGNRRSGTRGGEPNPGHVAHVFVEAEPGVTSVEADVPQGNTTVRVNGIRQGNQFYLKLPVGWGNRVDVEFRSIRANGVGQPEFLRTLKQPVSVPEVRWTYTWDAQERLTAMETDPADVSKGAERRRLEFVYDARGRRVVKRVRSGWTGLAYSRVEERRFVYDEGWNVLGETVSVNGAAPVLDRRYVWGLDLSGTETGAGGVHGLVAAVRPGAPAGTRRELPVYDGNGNVERVVTETGEVSARYEYGPFGEEITRRGVGAQPYRFSTKYHDEETGLLYYGYRYYAPRLGRWLSKDPIGERGGVNLYGFCVNNAIQHVDRDGREIVFAGEESAVNRAKEIFEEVRAKASQELAEIIKGIESDTTSCRIRVTWSSELAVIGNFQLGLIDLGDINKLPTTGGGLTSHAAFFHELYEQWEKVKYENAYRTAHRKAVDQEVLISGNRRVEDISKLHQGWNLFSNALSGKIIFRYRRVLKIDKDGKEVLDAKVVSQVIEVDGGNVTSSSEH